MSKQKAKHTPGPWNLVKHYDDVLSVVDGDGYEHVEASDLAILLDYQNKLGIPHWAHLPQASREISKEEQEANARLIAAAPELLESLKEVVGLAYPHPLENKVLFAVCEAAKSIIAKAEGRES